MATNLKRSKKIRAFCYRMIATGALCTAIATAIMGREAIVNVYREGVGTLTGDIYYLTEFREYISLLYNKAMIGYAGNGDDNGYPLTDSYAVDYANQAVADVDAMLDQAGDDLLYYIQEVDGTELDNISYPLFSEYDGHLLLPEDVRLCCYWDGPEGMLQFFSHRRQDGYDISGRYRTEHYRPNREQAANMRLVLAVKKDRSGKGLLAEMTGRARYFRNVLILLIASISIWVIFGLLALFTGKAARQAREEFAGVTGKIWLEGKLILIALAVYVVVYTHLGYFGYSLLSRMQVSGAFRLYFPLGCLIYLFFVDLSRNMGKVFTNSLPVKCCRYTGEFIHGQPWYRRAVILCIGTLAGAFMMFIGGGFLFFEIRKSKYHYIPKDLLQDLTFLSGAALAAGLILLYCFIRQRNLLKDTASIVGKLSEMREGGVNTPLVLSGHSLLRSAAKDLNELENGIENAVEQKNRSNRMRVELLTNVSHDLKTPLTSIINYADLLCEEELPDAAAEYASALQGKAYRLKNMVQDVFELSKATSGNLPVEKNLLDLTKLIRQTLADMDERIQESDLVFKLNINTEPLMIEADGEKLYRVFQNLFVNALQYSLEHSRVHVQLTAEEGYAVARVKNTSRMELDFDPNEIVERFVRADSSRTSEGSGLGLSIVQSFTEACGGEFAIQIDADMFTACVRFPLSDQTVNNDQTEVSHEEE